MFLTLLFAGGFAVISTLILPYLLDWLGKSVYLDNYKLFYWMLLATILNALGMIPHYAVYAQKRDSSIIQSHLAALPIFVVVVVISTRWTLVYAVPIGLCASQLTILVWKLRAYLQLTPTTFRGIRKV